MILLNDFRRQWRVIGADILRSTEKVGASGWYILGHEVRCFEANLAHYWSVNEVVGVANGLDALEISLRVLGCKDGDRVLTSPISAFATVMAILRIGAVPILLDSDDFGLLDLDACRQFLKRRHDVRFLVPVHLYGHALDSAALTDLRDEFGLSIVEDCAQSIGAKFHGKLTGKVGQLSATSFYPTKNLGGLGDGGGVLTDSIEAANQARILRDYGQKQKYHHALLGYNSRLDELQAAYLGQVFLPRLDEWIARRRHAAHRYSTEISNRNIHCVGSPPGSDSSWHLFPIIVEPELKPSFISHLHNERIQTGEHYPLALVEQEALARSKMELASDCHNAIRFCHSEVSLPIHPFLNDDEISAVVAGCNSWRPPC
jgi:dTDP-3-amino-3,4,6-trideoxy-alpha-D-glucose transaminase